MIKIKKNINLSKYTTFKIGGVADFFVSAESEKDIKEAIDWAEQNKQKYFVLGGGSNVLFSDKGYKGLVVKINNSNLKIKETVVKCDAGVLLSKLVSKTVKSGFCNFAWAVGIPGAVGGAIFGNAGAYGGDMSSDLLSVNVLKNGKIIKLKKNECGFNYRNSMFKKNNNKSIIISAEFALKKSPMKEIEYKMRQINKERKNKFGKNPSVGCIFKNIEIKDKEIKEIKKQIPDLPDKFIEYGKVPAGWLIERCGLRGKRVGDAVVSNLHGSVIENLGNASSEDVIILISYIKQQVRDRFGFQLNNEIQIIEV